MPATFQSTVFFQQGFGVPGELFTDGPYRSQSFIINSALASYNIIGAAAFTITSQGVAAAGNVSGTAVFAGILATPKNQPLQGTVAGGTLAPSLVLPNQAQADLITMGSLIVTLPAAAAIGDYVIFDNTTGALSTIPPGTTLPTGKTFANAVVDYYTVTAAGLAVITMTNTLNNI
jgi:hypothetical protein